MCRRLSTCLQKEEPGEQDAPYHLHTLGDLHILHLTVLVMMIHEPGNCIDLGTHTPQQIRSLPDHHRITTSPHHTISYYA